MKKFLSLVLALTMALSLAVVGASATAYSDLTDKSAITHTAAVEAMNELGIITGYTDGSFQPEGGLNRAEAAKIICYIMMGSTAADKLTTTSVLFKDVPTSHWAAAYINYCANLGVIDGYGNGNYGPYDKVTGYQFAKMLLSAVGYNANNNLVGDGWRINTAKLALTLGMLGDETADCSDAVLSRDSACLYAFNTLKDIDIVTYNRGTDGYTSTNATYGEQTYGMLATTGYDSQHNPGTTYTSRIFPGFKVFATDGNIKTYTSKMTTVPSLGLGSYGFASTTLNYNIVTGTGANASAQYTGTAAGTTTVTGAELYVNGVQQTELVTLSTGATATLPTRIHTYEQIMALTGNGVKVSVYLNSNNQISLVTVTRSYLAEVTSVNTSTKTVTYKVFDGQTGVNETKALAKTANTVLGTTTSTLPQTSFSSTTGFGSVAVKDMVMVTPVYAAAQNGIAITDAGVIGTNVYLTVAGSIDSVYAATKVTGIASAKTATTATIGGTVYTAAMDTSTETGTNINELLLTGAADATAYLDQYGYLFSVGSGSVATSWLYLIDTVSVSVSGVGYNVLGIRAILADGTTATYPLISDTGAYYPATNFWDNTGLSGAYLYTLTNGAAFLKALTPNTTNTGLKIVDGATAAIYVAPAAAPATTKGAATIGGNYAAAGMSTIFLGGISGTNYNSVTFATKATASGVQTMVTTNYACVVTNGDNTVEYVFYMGSSASSSVYLTKVSTVNNIANDAGFDNIYYGVFTGYVNGVKGTYKIQVPNATTSTAYGLAQDMLYKFYDTYAAEGYASQDVLKGTQNATATAPGSATGSGVVNVVLTAGTNTSLNGVEATSTANNTAYTAGKLVVGGAYLNDGSYDYSMANAVINYVGEQNQTTAALNSIQSAIGVNASDEAGMTAEALFQYITSYNYAVKATATIKDGAVVALYITNWADATHIAG